MKAKEKLQDDFTFIDHAERITRLESFIENLNGTLSRMDGRLDKMDGKIDLNFKWLLGIVLGAHAGLFGLMAHGFHWF